MLPAYHFQRILKIFTLFLLHVKWQSFKNSTDGNLKLYLFRLMGDWDSRARDTSFITKDILEVLSALYVEQSKYGKNEYSNMFFKLFKLNNLSIELTLLGYENGR